MLVVKSKKWLNSRKKYHEWLALNETYSISRVKKWEETVSLEISILNCLSIARPAICSAAPLQIQFERNVIYFSQVHLSATQKVVTHLRYPWQYTSICLVCSQQRSNLRGVAREVCFQFTYIQYTNISQLQLRRFTEPSCAAETFSRLYIPVKHRSLFWILIRPALKFVPRYFMH